MKKTRIMYIEDKSEGITGPARIGRVTFSKTGKSVNYKGRLFQKTTMAGGKANYFDSETRQDFWISGCKKDGSDRLYSGTVEIDDDVRDEYWLKIRKKPDMAGHSSIRASGKYSL